MPPAERAALFTVAEGISGQIVDNQVAALRARSIPSLAADFASVSESVTTLAPGLSGAAVDVTNLYGLNADDLKSTQDDVQFFCGLPGAQLLVTVTIPSLPPGHYALAVVHATGSTAPQQFALILQNIGTAAQPAWMLAGYFARPLRLAGHDSVWFWQQARALKTKGDTWSAFFDYQAAAYLARPTDLFTSPNLEKLSRETAAVEPPGLPGAHPMLLSSGTESWPITGLRVDDGLGALDLRVDARVDSVSDPVAARKTALAIMSTLLAQHPGMRTAFHGLWVYETTASGQSFAVEQPCAAIP